MEKQPVAKTGQLERYVPVRGEFAAGSVRAGSAFGKLFTKT